VPFSAGPRNCIGQKFALLEEKLSVACLFRQFNVSIVAAPGGVPVVPRPDIVLKADPGVYVKLERRN
jgi:cytochrome P450